VSRVYRRYSKCRSIARGAPTLWIEVDKIVGFAVYIIACKPNRRYRRNRLGLVRRIIILSTKRHVDRGINMKTRGFRTETQYA